MSITVTMLQTRQGEGGAVWTAGNSYSASDAFGTYLITSNLATGQAPAVPVTTLSPAQVTATAALVSGAGNPQNRIVALGDSITARSNTTSGSTQLAYSTGFIPWGGALMGGAIQWVNAGISGNTTAQMLARYATDVAPYPSRWLHVLGGGNDISASVSGADVIASLSSILALAYAENRRIVLGTIYPFGAHTSQAQKAAIAQVNRWVRQQATDRVLVADYYDVMVDAAGAIRTNVLVDTIHPTPYGASLMGRVLATVMAGEIPVRNGLLSASQWDADNALSNGQMVGNHASGASSFTASTGMTGNGPRGWTWRRGTGAAIVATVSKQARSGGIIPADFARAVIGTSGADHDTIVLERIVNFRLWSSAGTANLIRRFYVPSTGAQYDVLVDGTFATGADPTAGWPTAIGSQFTDGTATLVCVPPIQPGCTLQSVVECNISSIATGLVQPSTDCYVKNAAGTTQYRTYGLYYDSGSGTNPAAAEAGAGLVIESPTVAIGANLDLSTVTTSAGPSFGLALTLAVTGSATATVDWGRATLRVG